MSYVIALVYAWLMDHPEHYCTWVESYVQLRYDRASKRNVAVEVGGHWRRNAKFGALVPALRCVCKFEILRAPRVLEIPMRCYKKRRDESGSLIHPKLRLWVWS